MKEMNQQYSDAGLQPIIKWSAAKAAGAKQYFTGVPCKHGHICMRDVSDRSCYECKLAKAAEWKKHNAEQHAEKNKAWAKANPEKARRTQLKQRSKDPKRYWATSTFQNARKRAALKNVPFAITTEDIYILAGGTCPVFDTAFDFVGNGRIVPESPSLDRIRPELGYVLGNVAVISMRANTIKQNATAEQIQRVADWLKTASAV
jgi:hypothetical protein